MGVNFDVSLFSFVAKSKQNGVRKESPQLEETI